MTASREPWTTQHNSDGTAVLRDADGLPIATVSDWRNADRVIELASTIATLQAEIEALEKELEHGTNNA